MSIGQGVFPPIKVQNGNTCFQYHFKNNQFLLEWVSSILSGAVLVQFCDLSFTTGLSWVLGNAEELPFDDEKFDVYTIAFGIRNVTRIDLVS